MFSCPNRSSDGDLLGLPFFSMVRSLEDEVEIVRTEAARLSQALAESSRQMRAVIAEREAAEAKASAAVAAQYDAESAMRRLQAQVESYRDSAASRAEDAERRLQLMALKNVGEMEAEVVRVKAEAREELDRLRADHNQAIRELLLANDSLVFERRMAGEMQRRIGELEAELKKS